MIAGPGQQDQSLAGARDHGAVGNPFDGDAAARRYALGRPYYHRAALRLAARQLGLGRARLADALCAEILDQTAPFFPGPGPAQALFGIRLWTATRA